MVQPIGPKRLQQFLSQPVPLQTLPPEEAFAVASAMIRFMSMPPGPLPKRARPGCGATCRDGHPCQAKAVWDADRDAPRNGRCRLHGGLATGPRTPEGRRRIGDATRQRAQARRFAQVQAAAQAQALAVYRQAVAVYKETCHMDTRRMPGFKEACMQVQGGEVTRAYQRCLTCGVDRDTLDAIMATPDDARGHATPLRGDILA